MKLPQICDDGVCVQCWCRCPHQTVAAHYRQFGTFYWAIKQQFEMSTLSTQSDGGASPDLAYDSRNNIKSKSYQAEAQVQR